MPAGMAYANGELGLEVDGAKALEYYTKAADSDDARAQWRLGGLRVRQAGAGGDGAKALEYYTKAAEGGIRMHIRSTIQFAI